MAEERTYYVICDDNCKFESMTKEEILTAITNAVQQGSFGDIDTGFVTKVKEQNRNVALKFWVGTQAEYNALSPKPNNTFCIITDDEVKKDIETAIADLQVDMTAAQTDITTLQNGKAAKPYTFKPTDAPSGDWFWTGDIDKASCFLAKVYNTQGDETVFVPLTKHIAEIETSTPKLHLSGSLEVIGNGGIETYVVDIAYEESATAAHPTYAVTTEKVICYYKNGDTLALESKQTTGLSIEYFVGLVEQFTEPTNSTVG